MDLRLLPVRSLAGAAAAFALAALATLAVAAAPSAAATPSAVQYLPRGEVVARVMTLALSVRGAELDRRMRASLAQHREWLTGWIAKTPPGRPLPWHENMGITKTEYAELLAAYQSVTLRETRTARLRVVTADSVTFRFETPDSALGLAGVELDLGADEVRTRFGVANDHGDILPDSTGTSPVGAWRGERWSLHPAATRVEDVAKGTQAAGTFSLGRRQDGSGLLYYHVTATVDGRAAANVETVLYYPIARPNSRVTGAGRVP